MNEQGFVGAAYAPVVVFFATGVAWIWFIPNRGLLCAKVGIFNLSAKVVSIKKVPQQKYAARPVWNMDLCQ